MINATGSGMVIRLSASETYPAGISLTAFADDKDPFKVGDLTVNEFAMGLNGDAVVFGKAGGIKYMAAISSENLRTYRNYSRERPIKKVMKYKGPRYFISVNEEEINDEIVTSAIFVGKEKGDTECIVLEEIIDYGME